MRIGFFVGHAQYVPHARLLSDSIIRLKMGDVYAVVPAHINLTLSIPGVTQITCDVPEPLRKVPFADKLLAAAAFEQDGGDFLWVDVDSCFFKAPPFPAEFSVMTNPVDKKNIGDAFGEPHSPLWQLLYEHFDVGGICDRQSVRTTASGEIIYPYFNMGMVAVRENRGLFSTAARELRSLFARKDVRERLDASPANMIFFHQAVFTCTLLSLYGINEVRSLPKGVNYPLHLHAEHVAPIEPKEWISIRYDDFFHDNDAPVHWQRCFDGKTDALKMTWYYGD